jgi:hypothetical protein
MSTVRQALQSALDENGGTIPFDAFMGIALHHPQDGYYTRNFRGICPFGIGYSLGRELWSGEDEPC